MNADGSNVVQRTFGSVSQYPTWSPDGTKIAFSSYVFQTGDNGIFVIDATSGSPSLLYTGPYGNDNHPAWSPDGAKIAFTSIFDVREVYYGNIEYFGIGAINSDGTGFTWLATSYSEGYQQPDWSPDGMKLSVTIDPINTSQRSIGVMNADGTGLIIINTGIGMSEYYDETRTSWSPNGTLIAYADINTIKWVAANGSAAGTIIANGWGADWQH
jgi:Tol biopolymer transport system component